MGIGMRELVIILFVALVLFGTKRLRGIGSDLGGALRGFKDALGGMSEVVDGAVDTRRDRDRSAQVALVATETESSRDGVQKVSAAE